MKAAADVDVRGLIVSLNRMEVGKGGVTTAQKEIEAKYGFPVASIVSMAEVKECLHNHEVAGRIVIDDDIAAAIDAYYEQWGAKESGICGCNFPQIGASSYNGPTRNGIDGEGRPFTRSSPVWLNGRATDL